MDWIPIPIIKLAMYSGEEWADGIHALEQLIEYAENGFAVGVTIEKPNEFVKTLREVWELLEEREQHG